MTNEDIRKVRDVLRECVRLSYSEADALTREIAHRCKGAVVVDIRPVCEVTHPNWDGPMICGNPLPCATHGGR